MLKKIFFCVVYILVSMACYCQAPGTTADPLVSKSYVDRFLTFREVSFRSGAVIPIKTGSMFILISGKAHLDFKNGNGMIDLTGGLPLKSGKAITLNRLYVACDNEDGYIKIDKDSKALVLGINEVK